MNIRLIGCSHHDSPIEVRERLAFGPGEVRGSLERWLETNGDCEAVLLSTCNRTEFYVASENGSMPEKKDLADFLLAEKPENGTEFPYEKLFMHDGREAAEHLFAVASSIESMVLGEAQILSQVKTAYQAADETGTAGPLLHSMFQDALKTAKRVAAETEIHHRRTSIPSVAVSDFALQIFERLSGKKTLVLGAGEMAEETLRYLSEHGANDILVINRSREKAIEVAARWNGSSDDWENRFEALANADMVISTTGSQEPIVTLDDYLKIEQKRRGRLLFALDLALPRDLEPSIGERPNVYLYSIDDLKATCEMNRNLRDREIPKARKIIRQETELFIRDLRHRKTGAVIKRLRNDWEQTKEAELKRLFQKLPDLDSKSESEIRYAFDRLVNKLLHPPLESLRDESKQDVPNMLLDALSRLFRLKD